MSEQPTGTPLLREALALLAMSPANQSRLNGPGCLACELMEDFDHAMRVAIADAPALTAAQRELLDQIDSAFQAMDSADYACFDNSVVARPKWTAVRASATKALREFGWENTKVAPFVEVRPGVWRRPSAEA